MTNLNLVFTIDRKKTLNSNSFPRNTFIKSSLASNLRNLGYETGLEELTSEQAKLVKARKKILELEAKRMLVKKKITQKIKKSNPDLTPKETAELSEKETAEAFGVLDESSSAMKIDPIFNIFKVKIHVSPPSKRRVDPVNFYPTIKHIVDGLTDCGFWVDDDWEHLIEMSFVYGQVNDTKTSFQFTLEITEVEDNQ